MSKRNRLRFSELNEKINNIDLDQKVKSAILEVIDEKVEVDMEKVLSRMDMLSSEFKTENQSLKNELKIENQSFKNELKTENQSLKSELKNGIKVVYWVIGVATAIIGLMIAFKK